MQFGGTWPSIPALRDPCGRNITKHRERALERVLLATGLMVDKDPFGREFQGRTPAQLVHELRSIEHEVVLLTRGKKREVAFRPVAPHANFVLGFALDGRYALHRQAGEVELVYLTPASPLNRPFDLALRSR